MEGCEIFDRNRGKSEKSCFSRFSSFGPFLTKTGVGWKMAPLAILWKGRARFPAASWYVRDYHVRDTPLKSHHGETWLSCFPSRNSVGSLNPLCNIVDAGIRAIGMTIPLGSNVHVGLVGPMGWITALSVTETVLRSGRRLRGGEERCRTGIQQPCAGNKIYLSLFILVIWILLALIYVNYLATNDTGYTFF